MDIFSFKNYKSFVRDEIAQRPKRGRGQFRALALHLGVHTTLVSQVFKGDRHLTLEQAALTTEFFTLTPLESQMFMALVEMARAGTPTLRKLTQQRIDEVQQKAERLKDRLPAKKNLSNEEGLTFYSSWVYSAIRLTCDLDRINHPQELANYLGLPIARTQECLEFLISTGLVEKGPHGLRMGPQSTHIGANSPLVSQHHRNWRLWALNRGTNLSSDELMFTAPMTISEEDFLWLRNQLLKLFDAFYERVKDSKSEMLANFNVDLTRAR